VEGTVSAWGYTCKIVGVSEGQGDALDSFFIYNTIHVDLRSDSFGEIRLAEQATVLAEARTRSFDVLALSQYTAVRMLIFVFKCFYDD